MTSDALDPFRAALDHLDAAERTHQLLFFRALDGAGEGAVAELEPRLTRPGAPRPLRRLILEGCFYHAWPGAVPMLARALRHEADPELFALGVAALGRIGGGGALAALKELSQICSSPGFQTRVAEVLAQADPAQAWDHHLGLLLMGSGNPTVANEAARQLGPLVDPTRLDSLRTVLMHPDLLVFRHALRLVTRVHSPEAGTFLAGFLEECHREALEDRALKETFGAFRGLNREAAREMALARLSAPFVEAETEALDYLRAETGAQAIRSAKVLCERASGAVDRFLAQVLLAVAENKGAALQSLPTEGLEELNLRARRLAFALDAGAEGLVSMVKAQLLAQETALPILEAALRQQTGREGVARALAALVPAENAELLEMLIHHPDNALRAAALEVLGERQEEALRPVLLAAFRDPISDIAQRAMLHLGQLPGAEQVATELLRAGHLEDIRLGIRFIGLHHLAGLAQELLELVTGPREELALEALEALGSSASVAVAPALLELLHSGQNPRMQLGLAQALRDMGQAEWAERLCLKADELKHPLLHAVAFEGLVRVQETLGQGGAPQLLAQFQGAWEGRNPWATRLRVVLALPSLALEDRKLWAELAALVQGALVESRTGGGWASQDLAKVQGVAREIVRRAAG